MTRLLVKPATAEPLDTINVPAPSPFLIEHLKEVFATTPSGNGKGGLDGAIDAAIAVAEARGRSEVINYLVALTEQ